MIYRRKLPAGKLKLVNSRRVGDRARNQQSDFAGNSRPDPDRTRLVSSRLANKTRRDPDRRGLTSKRIDLDRKSGTSALMSEVALVEALLVG